MASDEKQLFGGGRGHRKKARVTRIPNGPKAKR